MEGVGFGDTVKGQRSLTSAEALWLEERMVSTEIRLDQETVVGRGRQVCPALLTPESLSFTVGGREPSLCPLRLFPGALLIKLTEDKVTGENARRFLLVLMLFTCTEDFTEKK